MSRFLILSIAFLVAGSVCAQRKNDFSIHASAGLVHADTTATTKLELTISRAKRYESSNMMLSVGTTLPDGLSVSFDPAKGAGTVVSMTIAVTGAAKPGDYNLLVNCTIGNKTKGIIIKVTVL